MADAGEDWGDLADLFGEGREPSLVPYTEDDIEPVWVVIEGSTNVAEVVYYTREAGPEGTSLGMRFLNGGEYYYWGVPRTVYAALLAASSVGHDHWDSIRRRGYRFLIVKRPDSKWKSRRRRGG